MKKRIRNVMSAFDHLVVAARSRKEGLVWAEKRLGVVMSPGGEHPKMGTHNGLLRLGEGSFLEIIAINPEAPPPARPRWFGLDRPEVQKALEAGPKLLAWVANTDDLGELLATNPGDLGFPEPMSRGNLTWHFAMTRDGIPPGGGMLPHLIQWHCPQHPAMGLEDSGCRLVDLQIRHSRPEWLYERLDGLGLVSAVRIIPARPHEGAALRARLSIPTGVDGDLVELLSPDW